MTREERIATADKAFISELEDSLRRNIKRKYSVDVPKDELAELIQKSLKSWIRKKKAV